MLNGWSVVMRIEDSLKSIIIQRMCLSYNCYDVDGCWQCNTHEDRYENDGTIKRMKKRKWRWWWRERGNGDDASVDVKEQDDSNNNNDPFPCSQKQLQMLWHETVLWARLWHTIDKPASISQPRYPLRGLEDVSGTFPVSCIIYQSVTFVGRVAVTQTLWCHSQTSLFCRAKRTWPWCQWSSTETRERWLTPASSRTRRPGGNCIFPLQETVQKGRSSLMFDYHFLTL